MVYPLLAAKEAKLVDEVYLSTDSPQTQAVGRAYGARIIERPVHLATDESLAEEVFAHGYRVIREELRLEKKDLEALVLLFCNAPMVTSELIEEGIHALGQHPEIDSAVSVSIYNMWSPLRARRLGKDGLLHPFVPLEAFGDPLKMNCDRDSQGDVFFADMSVSVVRPKCLEDLSHGLLPQRWMGRKIYPLKQWGGLDVDYEWQIPQAEFWLRGHGVEAAAGVPITGQKEGVIP